MPESYKFACGTCKLSPHLDNAARKLVDEQYSTVILITWLRYGVNGDDSRDGRTVYGLPFFQRTRQVSPGCWPRYRHSHLHHPHQPHLHHHRHHRHHHLIIVIIFSPFPFGRICLVVLVKRKAGKSKWSLTFSLYVGSFVFHVHSYQDQFIQPGCAECFLCVFSLCFVCSFVLFDLFVCPHSFLFRWAVESSPLQFLALA